MRAMIIHFIVILMFLALSEVVMGQPPLPPSGGHGSESNSPPGAGAPVGSGVIILLTLSVAYGTKKMYNTRKDKNEN